jgi:hypothetical protein
MLSPVERKIAKILAELRPKNEKELQLAYMEILKRLGDEHPYLYKYSMFLKILKRMEEKLQKAIKDWTLLQQTGLFNPRGKLLFDVDKAINAIKIVIVMENTSLKNVVKNGNLSIIEQRAGNIATVVK